MATLLNRLAGKKILVSDGAWGTMLQSKGLKPGDCPELWNVTHPEEVRAIAAAYSGAGSDMVLTNTFGGSPLTLKKYGLEQRTAELNAAGVRLSRQGAPQAVIAGSLGPSGVFLEPLGSTSAEELQAVFAEQIQGMLQAGVRVICVETMSAVEEAACAVKAAKAADPSVEVIATMTFEATPQGFRTMMGVDCQQAVEVLSQAGSDILGANCGNGIEQMVPIVREFRRFTDKPILVHPNAGKPELDPQGNTIYRQSPEEMAHWVDSLVEAGVNIIGGCCGTTPDHIAALRRAVDKLA